jgi:hypothetical protein
LWIIGLHLRQIEQIGQCFQNVAALSLDGHRNLLRNHAIDPEVEDVACFVRTSCAISDKWRNGRLGMTQRAALTNVLLARAYCSRGRRCQWDLLLRRAA